MIGQKVKELQEAIKKECGVERSNISINIFHQRNGGINLLKARKIGEKLVKELGGRLVIKKLDSGTQTVSNSSSISEIAEFTVFSRPESNREVKTHES